MLPGIEWIDVPKLAAIGLFAGTAGGLIGVGGSIVMVPALTLLLHRDQHLAQAAAMIVNVAIAIPATIKHHLTGRVRWDVARKMLPIGVVFMVAGVALSNTIDSLWLQRVFAVFLLYVMTIKILNIYKERNQEILRHPQLGIARVGVVASLMGFIGGLTGTAGGPVAVPLLQRICHLHLREAIAASSAVMCVTSTIGAIYKNLSLGSVASTAGDSPGFTAMNSLAIAACLIPTAVLGSLYGATLTHKLPILWVKVIFVVLILWAALLMLDVFSAHSLD
jgi:uncharacterized membrane protein YfcA